MNFKFVYGFLGISYSVSAQQYLVDRCLTDNQEFLEALAPDQLLDSDLLALDENSLKTQLSEMVIEQTQNNISAQEHSMFNKDLTVTDDPLLIVEEQYKSTNLRRSQRQQTFIEENNDEQLCLLKLNFFLIRINNLFLVSCIHTITDKPVPSRARATLPENYLTINKLYEGKRIFNIFLLCNSIESSCHLVSIRCTFIMLTEHIIFLVNIYNNLSQITGNFVTNFSNLSYFSILKELLG